MSTFAAGHPLEGATKCPHCGQLGVLKQVGGKLRQLCGLCGGPRVFMPVGDIELSGREVDALRDAKDELRKALRLSITSTILSLAFVAVIATHFIFGVSTLFGTPLVVMGAIASVWSLMIRRGVPAILDKAWLSAVKDVIMQSPQGVSAHQIADTLSLRVAEAEGYMRELGGDNRILADVDSKGEAVLKPLEAVVKTRIDAGAEAAGKTILSDDPELEARFHALEDQMAENEAAQAEAGYLTMKK